MKKTFDDNIDEAIKLIDDYGMKAGGSQAAWVRVNKEKNTRGEGCTYICTGPCHGETIGYSSDAIVSSLYRAYKEQEESSLDDYYSEVMPYFESTLLRPFVKGDRHIVVDSHAPGNVTLMCLISSRQPWENKRVIPAYQALRTKLNPFLALYASHYVKHTRRPSYFYGEHDAFSSHAKPENVSEFLKTGKFDKNKFISSFHKRSRRGVHTLFGAADKSTPFPKFIKRHSGASRDITRKGFLGRDIRIPCDITGELGDAVTKVFSEFLSDEEIKGTIKL